MTVDLAGLTLAGPVLVASGCGGTGRELAPYGDLTRLGAFVTRTLTLDPRDGGPAPRVVETDAGFARAAGLANPGLERFLTSELPWLAQQGIRTFVSVAAGSPAEYAELARRLGQAPGVSGIEVNLAAEPETFDAREPFQAARAVAAVRAEVPRGVLVLAKLGPDPVRLVEVARTVAEAGADAVVLVNAAPALLPDGREGWLSGPAIRPLARRAVHDVHTALPDLPLVGVGGIASTADARAFLAAGATAVQVGSALLSDPTVALRIAAELEEER
jgi:dihydroorotate dehydrogenase (NAD+) catalytic subunit